MKRRVVSLVPSTEPPCQCGPVATPILLQRKFLANYVTISTYTHKFHPQGTYNLSTGQLRHMNLIRKIANKVKKEGSCAQGSTFD